MESSQTMALFAENEPFRATKMWNDLVRNFKSGVHVKRKRWRMRYYDDSFSGTDAVAWIHDFLKLNPNFSQNVSRSQAKLLCQKLLQRNIFEDVAGQSKSTKLVFEENHLYKFVVRKTGIMKDFGRIKDDSGKENETCTSRKPCLTVKRHSSFSDRFQLTRKPLTDKQVLQSILKDDKISKKSQSNNVNNSGQVFQNLATINAEPSQSQIGSRALYSRKGVSYNISLLGKNVYCCDEDIKCNEMTSESNGPSGCQRTSNGTVAVGFNNNKDNCYMTGYKMTCQVNEPGSQQRMTEIRQLPSTNDHSHSNKLVTKNVKKYCDNCKSEAMSNEYTGTSLGSHEEEWSSQTDHDKMWMTVCCKRLQYALNVEKIDDILDPDLLSWKNVMENITSVSRCVETVPRWLVSAMKCLIHWPQSIKYRSADCSGFQDDVFKTIQEHFQLLPEPLITRQLIQVFTKISALITKCKLSGVRALQLALLILKKEKRQKLQLLLRFMIKVSNNRQLNLSSHLPTRELVIQTFVPCIFGEKECFHEILGIRITSFLMENYAEVFKIPYGLKFEVEQQIAFHRGRKVATQSNDVAFCLRVTKQEYEEQGQLGTRRFLEDLLESIVHDEKINEKERKKKLKQFQKTYPEIYLSRYPADCLSTMSQQSAMLSRVVKPLAKRHVKSLR